MGVYAREPWLIHFFKKDMRVRDFIVNSLVGSKIAIPGLICEIFLEEEKELSQIYEGILRCISNGKNKVSEIATALFSKKLMKKESAGMVQPYLVNLARIGLIEKLPIVGKKSTIYMHTSPIFEAYFYLDEKYNFSEREVNSNFIARVLDELLPKQAENFFRNLLAKIYGLSKGTLVLKDFDIDIVLQRFKKPVVFAEVKWKDFVRKEEIKKLDEKFAKFNGKKLLLIPKREVLEIEPKKS